jgi:LemA protein
VTNARASVGSIKGHARAHQRSGGLRQVQAAQVQLQSALSRLLVVAENYEPQVRPDFRDLQAQLEGTENRIAVARNRYIKSVQEYNTTVRSFPSNLTAMLFKMDAKPNFAVDNEKAISAPPTVDFSKQPAAPPAVPAPTPAPEKN